MDLAKLSDADLLALRSGDLSKISDEGLNVLKGVPLPTGKPPSAPPPADMGERSTWDEIRGGLASAPINMYLGAKQLIGKELTPVEKDVLQQNREAASRAPVSSIASNVLTAIPAAMIPGANTIAGGALIGAGQGALQPVTEDESRLSNMAVGGIMGGAVPAALRAGKAAKAALIDPFTTAGRDRIAAGVINRAAGNPNFAQNMRQGATAGFNPTLAQATGDEGIAALERAARATNPGAFGGVEQSQRQALAQAVRDIAKDPVARQAAASARSDTAESLYREALDPANQQELTPWLKGQVTQLIKRPSINKASKDAQRWALERGEKPSAQGSLRALHDVKQSIDDAINQAKMAGQGGEVKALSNTKDMLLTTMEKLSPKYGEARQTYAAMSRPINQMDIGQAFQEKLIPAIYRDMDVPQQLNAASFARALTDQGDDIARNVTGMGGSTLANTLEPSQLQSLKNVASDLQMMKVAENAGRGVGSDTIQKTAMSHLAAEAGIPNWAMGLGSTAPLGWLKQAGKLVYGGSDEAVQNRLAEVLANPQIAAQITKKSQPSALAEALRRAAIIGGQALPGLATQ